MVLHDKLVGKVPLRVRETRSELVQQLAVLDEQTIDSSTHWLKYNVSLQDKLKSVQCSLNNEVPRGNFSVWTWEPDSEYSLLDDDPLNRPQGSIVEVLVWERLNVLWNMAVVRSQHAATIANQDRDQRDQCCVILKDVMHYIGTSLALIAEHPDFPNASAVSNKQLWTTWGDFIESRIQRCNYAFLQATESKTEMLASSAAACKACMWTLLKDTELLKPSIRQTPLVLMWKDYAEALEVLFELFSQYHSSCANGGIMGQQQRMVGLVHRFRSLCTQAKTIVLVELKRKVEPKLQSIMERASESVSALERPSFATSVNPPTIVPWFYVPGEDGATGHFASSINGQQNVAISEPDKKRVKLKHSDSKALLPDKPAGEHEDFDLSIACELALRRRCWILVAIWSNNTDDKASMAIRSLVKREGLVHDIIKDNLLFHECYAMHAATFIDQYGVTKFPFIAIIHPMTQKIRWSLSDSDASSSLLADIIAEACMDLCSHDAFEGLSGEIRDHTLPGCDPPINLLYTAGGFRAALTEAATVNRWMLVNLQSDDCLASHFLNRDVWRDEMVESLVKENFVFWQKFDVSVEGRVFVKVFNVKKFPHVSILDPFSGNVVWRRDGWTAEEPFTSLLFAEAVVNLPNLELRKIAASRRSLKPGPDDDDDDESSWDLCSLFESWEKLSLGTSCPSQPDMGGLTLRNATNSSIPTEIITSLVEEDE